MKTQFSLLLAIILSLVAIPPTERSAASHLRYCEYISSHDSDGGPPDSLCADDLKSAPKWPKPMSSPPPLAVSDAVTLTHTELKRRFLKFKDWEPIEIGLHQSIIDDDKWYYTVRWRPTEWKPDDGQQTITIAILMDGRVI